MPEQIKGRVLYRFSTYYGYPVSAYEPVVGEKFGPWEILEVGAGPYIGRTYGELSFPDGTVMEMSGVRFRVAGVTLQPVEV